MANADTTIVIGARDETTAALETAAQKIKRLEQIARNSGSQLEVVGVKGVRAMTAVDRSALDTVRAVERWSDATGWASPRGRSRGPDKSASVR